MSLTPRSVEVLLVDYGRRNPTEFGYIYTGEFLKVPDVGELKVTDLVLIEGEYDSYGSSGIDQRLVIVEDEDRRLFRITVEESPYSSAVSVVDAKHVVAKPIDRVDYVAVKH